MKRKTAILFALLALLPFPALCQNDRVAEIVSQLREHWQDSKYDVVTPEIRNEVINQLRLPASLKFAETRGKSRIDFLILLRLGDEETLKKAAEAALRGAEDSEWEYLHHFVLFSGNPAVIPMIATEMFRIDGDTITPAITGDIGYYIRPRSIEACSFVLEIVRATPDFSSATKEWAEKNHDQLNFNPPKRT